MASLANTNRSPGRHRPAPNSGAGSGSCGQLLSSVGTEAKWREWTSGNVARSRPPRTQNRQLSPTAQARQASEPLASVPSCQPKNVAAAPVFSTRSRSAPVSVS